jgi:hypothetical protein
MIENINSCYDARMHNNRIYCIEMTEEVRYTIATIIYIGVIK